MMQYNPGQDPLLSGGMYLQPKKRGCAGGCLLPIFIFLCIAAVFFPWEWLL